MRETLVVQHQLRRAMEDDPDSESRAVMKSLLDGFGTAYEDFATNLRPQSHNGRPTPEWMHANAERSQKFCTSVENMVSRLSMIPTSTVTADQSLQPSITITAATGYPHPLRLETNQYAGTSSVSLTGAMVNADRSSWDYRFFSLGAIPNQRRRLTQH